MVQSTPAKASRRSAIELLIFLSRTIVQVIMKVKFKFMELLPIERIVFFSQHVLGHKFLISVLNYKANGMFAPLATT